MVPGAVAAWEGRSVRAELCEHGFDFVPQLVGCQRLARQLAESLALIALLDGALGGSADADPLNLTMPRTFCGRPSSYENFPCFGGYCYRSLGALSRAVPSCPSSMTT